MNLSYHEWRVSAIKFYQFIAEQTNVLHLPVYSDEEFISESFDETTNRTIDRSSVACKLVIELHDRDGVSARAYTRTTENKRMPRSGENRCKIWLKGYFIWLREQEEPITMPALPLPKLPPLKIPDVSMGAKLIGMFILLVLVLVALGYSGLGGAVGSRLEK